MGFFEILFLGVALSMDACAVAMANGMTDTKMPVRRVFLIGLFFGIFQFFMPLVGYFITGVVANAFLNAFEKISAWVSFTLLFCLGGKMLFEGIKEGALVKNSVASECEKYKTMGAGTSLTKKIPHQELTYCKLFLQAIATSIDALAVGVTLQMAAISSQGLSLGVWGATGVIGVVTFCLSVGAVYVGEAIGSGLADKAETFGGLVLVVIGLKILIESLI